MKRCLSKTDMSGGRKKTGLPGAKDTNVSSPFFKKNYHLPIMDAKIPLLTSLELYWPLCIHF